MDTIDLPARTMVAAAGWRHGNQEVAVFDRWDWSELLVRRDGSAKRTRPFPVVLDGRLIDVVPDGYGWIAGVIDKERGTYVVYRLASGRARAIGSVEIPPEHRRHPKLLLGIEDSTILIATPMTPFRFWAMSAGSGVVREVERVPDRVLLGTGDSVEVSTWRALSLIRMGCTYVASLADLAGERRVYGAFDLSGKFRRRAELNARIGFVSAVADRYAIAYRRIGHPELVTYGW